MMKQILDIIMFLLAALLISGCMGVPSTERQQSASVKTAEAYSADINERVKATFNAAKEVEGPVEVEVAIDSAITANDDQNLKHEVEESIPFAVKLLIGAVAGLLILLIIWIILKKSAAARATFQLADSLLAKQAKKLEGKLESNNLTDVERATILNQLRDFERSRGQLR